MSIVSAPAPTRRTGPVLWGMAVAVAAGLLGGVPPGAARAGGSGYTAYGDPHLGYALDRPAGWTVHADGHTILVQSPDRTETAFVETFDAPAGESAQTRLQQPTVQESALFPEAKLDLLPSAEGETQAAGALAFSGRSGPGQGRVLCRIAGTKGLIFVIAAPAGRFPQAQPALMHVVRSLRFLPAASSRGGAASGGGVDASGIGAIKRSLHFVTWTEPKEHAFHLQVPQGWKVEGGAFRYGATDVRVAYQAASPEKDITVVFGDHSLPTFEVPNPISQQLGVQELQPINESPNYQLVLLHYMAAPDFNRWYLEGAVSHLVDDLRITGSHDSPGANGQPGVSIAMTEFTGKDKQTGKELHGLLNTMVHRTGNSLTWNASPEMIVWDSDSRQMTRFKRAMVAYIQMKFSYAENEAWVARRRKEIFEATGRQLALTARIARQNAIDSDAKEAAIMGAFGGGPSTSGASRSGFADYIGDQQVVVGADGTPVKVSSGAKYHYQDSSGRILSTDSAYSPGVDWTLMTER